MQISKNILRVHHRSGMILRKHLRPNASMNEDNQSSTENVNSENTTEEITEAVDNQELNDNLCKADEELLFGFPITGSKKRLAVCIGGANQEYIIYRFGTKDKVEFEFPEDQTDSWNKFVYSYYLRGGRRRMKLDLKLP